MIDQNSKHTSACKTTRLNTHVGEIAKWSLK